MSAKNEQSMKCETLILYLKSSSLVEMRVLKLLWWSGKSILKLCARGSIFGNSSGHFIMQTQRVCLNLDRAVHMYTHLHWMWGNYSRHVSKLAAIRGECAQMWQTLHIRACVCTAHERVPAASSRPASTCFQQDHKALGTMLHTHTAPLAPHLLRPFKILACFVTCLQMQNTDTDTHVLVFKLLLFCCSFRQSCLGLYNCSQTVL